MGKRSQESPRARARRLVRDPEAKLKAVRSAIRYSFPTADIRQMLKEIEEGYRGCLPSPERPGGAGER